MRLLPNEQLKRALLSRFARGWPAPEAHRRPRKQQGQVGFESKPGRRSRPGKVAARRGGDWGPFLGPMGWSRTAACERFVIARGLWLRPLETAAAWGGWFGPAQRFSRPEQEFWASYPRPARSCPQMLGALCVCTFQVVSSMVRAPQPYSISNPEGETI